MHVFILYAYTPCVHLNRAGRGTTVSSAFSFSLYVLLRTCALATSNKICRKTTFHKKRKEKKRKEKKRKEKKRKEKKRKEKKRKTTQAVKTTLQSIKKTSHFGVKLRVKRHT
jgi:choline-glycine betaine transporter